MSGPVVALDVFAGVGWGVACEWLGIREYGVEIAPSAIRLRTANGMRTIYRDVWSGLRFPWMVPAHRLYIASPPCQTFSIAGTGEGRKALGDVLDAITAGLYTNVDELIALGDRLDPRTALVLAPLAHIWQHRPELVALEQVPEVLPVWHAYATVMRGLGYSVHVEVMRAEQFGVPQTRKRAILMARLDGKVTPPAPTHSRYYSSDPARLDQGVEKWVSMAEALGFGLASRPSPTITGGGTETGGAEPIAKYARYTESDDWVLRGNQKPPGAERYHSRAVSAPAQTITSQADLFRFQSRELEPGELVVRTSMGKPAVDGRNGSHELDPALRPSHTVTTKADSFLISQVETGSSRRLTHLEAAALQSFPPEMQWPGNQGEKFLAIGNAVPPLMAAAILCSLLAPPAERDAWDNVFAEVAG